MDSYGEQGLTWAVQALNRSDRKLFSLRSRVVVYDAGTVMCVELPRWPVGVRSAKTVCGGGVCN